MVGHLPTEALVFYAGDVPTPGGTQNERLVNSYAKPPRVVPITRLVAEKVRHRLHGQFADREDDQHL